MKRFFIIMLATIVAMVSFITCGNFEKTRNARIEAEFVKDSIAFAEFVKDSIARVKFVKDSIARVKFVKDSISSAKYNAEVIARCSNLFNVKKDEFSNSDWIEPKGAPKYRNRNGVYCYFSTVDGRATSNFRFVYQYYAEDWLFIRNMIFNIDGENITIVPDMNTDSGYGGKIWEWCDESVNYNTSGINEDFIKKIANATSVKVKMNGRQYYDTRTLSASQIKSIKDTYEYYLALGGSFSK